MPRFLPVLAVCLFLFGIVGLAYAGSNNPTHIPANSENFLHYLKHSVIRLLGLDHVKAADHFDPGSWSAEESNDDFVDGDDTTVAAHWAVLIAGSSGWGNYRHQADVCHAYQVLKRGGYSDKHIVVMVYDDIASSPMNPHHGKIINRPGGPDVYKGLTPDYSGDQVNAETFLAVLAGDAAALQGKGSGKVIASGPNDRVFVFYSDHGAPGILGMPTGNFLYADALMNTIKQKHLAGGFREMALYIEACESGSIFDGLLDDSLPVYAVTASNGMESSWGTYCPGDVPDPEGLSTCLGDLFSVAWMENADSVDLTRETLKNQYILVRQRTSNNYTYVMGSHALQFGRLTMQKELAGDYEGTQNKGVAPQPSAAAKAGDKAIGGARRHHAVAQRDADLEHLRATYARAADTETKASAKAALDAELDRRRGIDMAMARATARLLLLPQTLQVLATSLGLTTRQVFSRGSSTGSNMVLLLPAADNALTPNSDVVSLLMSKPLPGRPLEGAPVVDSWDCLRAMVQQWQDSCGAPMDQYAMKHTRLLANLCNAGLGPVDLQVALKGSGCEVQKAA